MTTSLPCVLMRSGTSRGPFFLREWLPQDDRLRDRVLQSAIGAADPSQINGLGGGSTLTSKVAMVSRSSRVDCDVDYLFAQVGPNGVDTRPNCGNMLAGVAPFAVEQGLISATDGMTSVRVHNVNTGARIDVQIHTPNGQVTYDGNISMDGVAGTAAPVYLSFLDAWGAVTGKLFPTGERINLIDGVEVTCIDAAMPMALMNAQSLGVTGTESASQLDAMPDLLARMERIRLQAGLLMGLGDVSASVMPKPVLVSQAQDPMAIVSRYFTPWQCHTAHAVTGAIGVVTAFALPGTVASRTVCLEGEQIFKVVHPSGVIQIAAEVREESGQLQVVRASVVRTVRKIMEGALQLPADLVFS
ncbi:4-oxalomesaconate tautomerase [Limnohabitans sp. Rim28]|uniref:4-oxalomesaconate tautomerase n=1 Tax=Limnohabitans sp. Rim28 TaxID=1100720 RepID=UPI00047498AC|nr:4-oxalomesaconate tautomerase [Limnohabitans sp. Rim28]PVE07754.1 4-oxalomesaconate tautomerase [Limnohabitans sp. Rim28]